MKSASSKCRHPAIIEPELASETYLTINLPRTNEPFRPVNPAVRRPLARNEPVGPCNLTFRGNNARIDSGMYLTKNLENYRTMGPEPENLKRACCVSESVHIIPAVCSGVLASLTS